MSTTTTITPKRIEGATAFLHLLQDLAAVPDVHVAGDAPGETVAEYDVAAGATYVDSALSEAGLRSEDIELLEGFEAALAWYVMAELKGYSRGLGDPAEDAVKALRDVERTGSGTAVEAPAGGRPEQAADDIARTGLSAAYEVEAIAGVLIEEFGSDTYRDEVHAKECLRMRGSAIRLKALAGVLVSALGDDQADADRMRRVVYGQAEMQELAHG